MAILVLNASPGQIAVLRAADLVPGFLIGLVAGVWIDRLRRRPVMIAADVGRAILLGSIPLVAVTGHVRIEQLYAVALLVSMLTVLFDVAEQSYIPAVVGRGRLVDANSKLAATQSIAEVGAFGIAGWLVQLFTAPVAIAIDALSFIASAGLVGTIRTAESRAIATGERRGMWREMLDGLRALNADRSLRAVTLSVGAMYGAFGMVGTLYSLYALRELGFRPGLLGLVFAVGGVSSLTAAMLAGRLTRRFGVGPTMVGGLLLAALGILFLPLARGAGLPRLSCSSRSRRWATAEPRSTRSISRACARRSHHPSFWDGSTPGPSLRCSEERCWARSSAASSARRSASDRRSSWRRSP